MLARILDEALDPQTTSSDAQPSQLILEPARNEATLGPVEDQLMLEPNMTDTLPMDSEAFLDWFDSVDWNNPMGF